MKINEIVFGLFVFQMGWHEGLRLGIYKGIEVQKWKWWIKMQKVLYVSMRDEKSWNIKLKDRKNIYFSIRKVLKHWTKWNKKSTFNLFLSPMWHLRIFQFSLHRMHHLAESHTFPHEVSAYIYIYIYRWLIELIFWEEYILIWLITSNIRNCFFWFFFLIL